MGDVVVEMCSDDFWGVVIDWDEVELGLFIGIEREIFGEEGDGVVVG